MKFSYVFSTFIVGVAGNSKHTSLDEPFQSSFKSLDHSPCVTLYHRNGRAGCGSVEREPQSGPLYYYDGSSEPPYNSSYVAVIEEYALSASTIDTLVSANTGNLKGILVLNSTYANNENEYSSPGPIYPLGYSTPSADISYGNIQYPWNGNGDGLNQYDLFGVPLAYVNEQEASGYIRESAQDAEKAVEIYTTFNYYMGPDGINSVDCLAWRDAADDKWNPKCLPLGGTSVWGFAGSPPPKANGNNNNNNNNKPTILFGAAMDSTSMFHDLAPGANEGASNILTLLMAAYLLGSNVDDATLDALNKRIVFGFFEGEAYGYLGSRRFINDMLNFQCDEQYTVNSVANDENSDLACLYPMQPSLRFKDLGDIAGMVTIDQLGIPSGQGNLYVHNENEGDIGTFLASLLKSTKTAEYTAVDSAAGNQADGGGFPYPPTPLTALQSLTGGGVPGAVLTGYDYVFTKRPPYQSHLNFIHNLDINYEAIASAATILARTAYAAAYDDGSFDYNTAAGVANNLIPELAYNDDVLVELANCLYVNGNCNMLSKYANMEAEKESSRTGFSIGKGESLGMPPNYYVGVYRYDYGQPFVRVGDDIYGAYDGANYGEKKGDAFGMQPRMLQQAIRNMLSDFLGRGSGENGNIRTCRTHSDCNGIEYCNSDDDEAVCSGSKHCVCQRAFYHVALDEALEPATNNATGYFVVSDDDNQVSPMWTEPYWSNDVGIKMYRVAGHKPGLVSLAIGVVAMGACFFVAVVLKVGMRKEKVY